MGVLSCGLIAVLAVCAPSVAFLRVYLHVVEEFQLCFSLILPYPLGPLQLQCAHSKIIGNESVKPEEQRPGKVKKQNRKTNKHFLYQGLKNKSSISLLISNICVGRNMSLDGMAALLGYCEVGVTPVMILLKQVLTKLAMTRTYCCSCLTTACHSHNPGRGDQRGTYVI